MNFLGHLFFSANDPELMYANLYGDFVKGNDLSGYSPKIIAGIRLHRSIDTYIDHHPAVVELMKSLYNELPKVTGIAIDLFFDHLLAVHWSTYHKKPLRQFLDEFYLIDISQNQEYPQDYRDFIQQLKVNDWISHYPTRFGLEKMCEGVSKRISFPNELKNAPKIFDKHSHDIENCFKTYMNDALKQFSSIEKH